MLVRKSETRIQRRTGRGIDKRNRRVKGRTRGKRGRKEEKKREREGWNRRVESGIQAFGNERKIGTDRKGEKTEGRQVKWGREREGWKLVKEERDGGMETGEDSVLMNMTDYNFTVWVV